MQNKDVKFWTSLYHRSQLFFCSALYLFIIYYLLILFGVEVGVGGGGTAVNLLFLIIIQGLLCCILDFVNFLIYRALQKLFEANSGRNKWKIIERGVSTQWDTQQMVVGICKEEIYEHYCTLKYTFQRWASMA